MERVELIVYSDYLCPWCYLAEHRLGLLQRELGDALGLEWRSFLLRPRPEPGRELEKFMRYTQSWLRPAAEPDAPVFRVWESSEGPPSHSVPAHLAAKAAAALGPDAFAALHARLLRAYFEQSRDVSATETLHALWGEAGLPEASFACLLRRPLVGADPRGAQRGGLARHHGRARRARGGHGRLRARRSAARNVPALGRATARGGAR